MDRIKRFIISILYKIIYFFYNPPQVRSIEDTLDFIIKNKCSVSRFGDGEIKWIYGIHHTSFQEVNENMDYLLKKILLEINKTNNNLIICIPEFFNGLNQFDSEAKYYYEKNFIKDGRLWKKFLKSDEIYFNSDITRPYIDYRDKTNKNIIFNKWKEIIKNRNVLMVEGSSTRFGVGNDLLKNAKTVKRILCPAENAFNKYDVIEKKVEEIASNLESPLILIALGPTATILSYNLSFKNFQAIDIGHTDLEYEWFLRNAQHKIPIENKVVNELGESSKVISSTIKDKKYNDEIVYKIK